MVKSTIHLHLEITLHSIGESQVESALSGTNIDFGIDPVAKLICILCKHTSQTMINSRKVHVIVMEICKREQL